MVIGWRSRIVAVLILSMVLSIVIGLGITLLARRISDRNATSLAAISLAGTWQFYWGQLLTPADFAHRSDALPAPALMPVPASWVGRVLGPSVNGGQPLPNFGVATYRTQVTIPSAAVGTHTVLILDGIGAAYQIWVNGQRIGGLGTLATPHDTVANTTETPQIFINLMNLPPAQHLDIVVQVSNYSFREGGIFGDVSIEQPYAATVAVATRYILPDAFWLGILCVVGLYHIMTYFTSRRDIELIYMAGLCLSIAVRSLCLNKFMLHAVLPDLSWGVVIKLPYIMKFVALLTFMHLMRALYRDDVNERVHRFFLVVVVAALCYVMWFPASEFTLTVSLQTALIVVIIIYYMFVLSYLSLMQHREGALLNLFGVVFAVVVIIHDNLLFLKWFDSIQLIPFGMLVLLLIHATIISYRYALFQQRNVQLAHELQEINRTLEAKVVARTEALHASNAQLVALVEQRSHLMANIAHDMGSPMVGVQSALHILNADTLNAQDKKDLGRLLMAKVNHVKRLVDDLFRLARLESGQLEFDWECVTVAEITSEINEYFRQMLREQGCELTMTQTITDTCAEVRVDRRQLYRVVQNLLDNAIKYSPDTQIPIEMTSEICASADGTRRWCMAITDHGIGIAPEQIAMIFTRFYTRNSVASSGSGLGLAITKEIVERHGGTIDVTSIYGQGSTFTFTFPIAD